MSIRDLTPRIDRLGGVVVDGEPIDLASLSAEVVSMLDRAPRLTDGGIDVAVMSEADLRLLAGIGARAI